MYILKRESVHLIPFLYLSSSIKSFPFFENGATMCCHQYRDFETRPLNQLQHPKVLYGSTRRRSKLPKYMSVCAVTIFVLTISAGARGDIEPQPHYEESTDAPILHNVHDTSSSIDGKSNNAFEPPDLGFVHAFVASLSVIVVSELGDKTFFIAAIMAMRHPRLTVFFGAIGALALMTVLSAVFGMAATIIPRVYTYYISTALFAIFGLKMLKEGYYMSANEGQEELEEVQSDLRKREDEFEKDTSNTLIQDAETGSVGRMKFRGRSAAYMMSRILMQAFTMTFLAEWGDRSQLTTIILSAREDVLGVIVGGVLGHSICTGLAVIGGRMIAQKISVRTVTIVGGVVFILFAISALFISPESETAAPSVQVNSP